MRRICTICARGGSKGVPGKNTRLLNGRPLIAHTITQAQQAGCFDAIAVSSDDDHVLGIARELGVDHLVRRPDHLSSDEATKPDAIAHCVLTVEKRRKQQFDIIVDLDVTSPLRERVDITSAIALLERSTATNVISAAPSRRSPYFNMVEIDDEGHAHLSKQLPRAISRRQDAPACYDMNASIYVWRRPEFVGRPGVFYDRTLVYEMPEERSHDIDTELDWDIVELLAQRTGS